MATPVDTVKKQLKQLRTRVRTWRLEQGEAGWGKPAPQPARLPGLSAEKAYRVAVIGLGGQGLAQCRGMKTVPGIDIVGVADLSEERLASVGDSVKIPVERRHRDAAAMLAALTPAPDLVSIATTAPYHVQLGRVALAGGARRILLEKPMDVSLGASRAFAAEARAAGATVLVNYSRRWSLDFRAVRRCIDEGFIGDVRSVNVTVGKGELAMHGSHAFDLCRWMVGRDAVSVSAQLEAIEGTNARGAAYQDPSGFCTIGFAGGARAFVDFSSDLGSKDGFTVIKGTLGRIVIDEQRRAWSLESRSQRLWTIPFSDAQNAAGLFARVVVGSLSEATPACSAEDGIGALELILGAHVSARRASAPVGLPLSDADGEIGVMFP